MNVANVEVLPVPISIVNEGRTAMKRMTKARLGTSFGRRYRPNARYIGRKLFRWIYAVWCSQVV
jgi:hypothetical protein